jgi:outer membrane beta-barrel protein
VWTPVYGKLAFLGGIVQYDLYLTTGGGVAWSQTSGSPVDDGAHPAAAVGLGQRFAFADFMAFTLGVRQLLYADRPGNREISEIQKVLTLQAGLSFWIPPTFGYTP